MPQAKAAPHHQQQQPLVVHIQAPTIPDFKSGGSFIFIAGGIGGCPDWQSAFAHLFAETYRGQRRVTLVNPRRATDFEINGEFAKEQITWEYHMLRQCSHVLFWFPKEALCPIALYELGVQVAGIRQLGDTLFCGWHPDYQRSFDLHVQLSLAKPGPVCASLEELARFIADKIQSLL